MADINNFSDLNEQFNTVKTMLNSIRAQGILNTSDVDKLLEGINTKLQRIDSVEDIERIKSALAELQSNLDERHSVLLSKFGAIEALFSNLLKNSTDVVKTGELKELFDIVATNLSVFSREVVTNKETLSDIVLRLDAMQADDTKKKEILKSVSTVRNDIEKLSNGFDSIVISLNENFKTILKTISEIDQSEAITGFANKLNDIINSSNAILSAIQLMDKKNIQIEDLFDGLATQDDTSNIQKNLTDLSIKSKEIGDLVDVMVQKSYKIDNLSDKIDAAVSIIAGLKTEFTNKDDESTAVISEKISKLESYIKEISSNSELEEFKNSLELILEDISKGSVELKETLTDVLNNVSSIGDSLKILNLDTKVSELVSNIVNSGEDIKGKITQESDKMIQLFEVNISRALNDISNNAEVIDSRLKDSHSAIADMCEKNFTDVTENIIDLRNIISQLEESNTSASNAIFASITDRLTLFENSLKNYFNNNESSLLENTSGINKKISDIKNIIDNIDFKADSSNLEQTNIKNIINNVKENIDSLLALNFADSVSDLKADLYAVKQELLDNLDSSNSEITEKLIRDFYSKYELIIKRLDGVEDEVKVAQMESMSSIKETLTKISDSIVDILSYVSNTDYGDNARLESKLDNVVESLKDNNLNYVENVRDIVDLIKIQIENTLKQMSEDSNIRYNNITSAISTTNNSIKETIQNAYLKLAEANKNFDVLKEMLDSNNINYKTDIENVLLSSDALKEDFNTKITQLKNSLLESVTEFKNDFTCLNADTLSELKFDSEHNYNSLKSVLSDISTEFKESSEKSLEELQSSFNYLKKKITDVDSSVDEDLARQVSIIEGHFDSLNMMLVDIMSQAKDVLGEKIQEELSGTTNRLGEILSRELEQYKSKIETTFEENKDYNSKHAEFIKDKVLELNSILNETLESQNNNFSLRMDNISNNLKDILTENIELSNADFKSLREKLEEFYYNLSNTNTELVDSWKAQFDDVIQFIDSNIDIQAEEVNTKFNEISNSVSDIKPQLEELKEKVNNIFEENSISLITHFGNTNSELSKKIKDGIQEFNTKLESLYEHLEKDEVSRVNLLKNEFEILGENTSNISRTLENVSTELSNKLSESIDDVGVKFEHLDERLNNDEVSRTNVFQKQIQELKVLLNSLTKELKDYTKSEIQSISDALVTDHRSGVNEIRQSVEDTLNTLTTTSADIAAGELQALENFAYQIMEKSEEVKQNSISCRDVIKDLLKEHFDILKKDAEKETDVIIGDILEQFNIMHDSQKDNLSELSNSIEGSVSGYIHSAVEDIKSFVEVQTDSSELKDKLDSLNNDMQVSLHQTASSINKLLQESVFNNSIDNLKATNQILVESMAENINSKLQDFMKENISKDLSEKISIFNKDVTDTIINKYDEVKILSGEYAKSFNRIAVTVEDLTLKFNESKNEINNNFNSLSDRLTNSMDGLKNEFLSLKAQIMNKSFDEAFHEAVKNQITGIENLVHEQMGYLENVQDLCCDNLPELNELSVLVKHSIMQTVEGIKSKLEEQDTNIPQALDNLKTEIITQFLNIFNQISFVTEQEEITEFIQDKHNELITVLSHIVTTNDEVINVKDNLASVDNKIDSIKEDIDLINEKITSIMSSDGNIDYVYSLQDLESDIANLRLVLNEMKADNKAKELEELINSTNNIYNLVEIIKEQMPKFEADEFKKEFDNLSEDIVSISTRTNKLILSSDESYKMLQDNLHDFKLVIDDLDERTKNFSKESGIDKLDNKISILNTMVQKGAKTNQVFNQVFEYLAEWVDKAGIQISEISNKVETLDDISQIKIMLEDLKAQTQDDTESTELVEALGSVFDKQAKRIASLEAKLDRIIVDSTINSKAVDVNIKPIEETLNKFLVAVEDKMLLQQSKINSLEEKLEEVMSLVDNKDTAQLTKKVGGMDKQLAKLNKSIEKIASNVVEK